MDEKTIDLFRNIHKQLNFYCGQVTCDKCAFDSKDYCGLAVMQSIMAKLHEGKNSELEQLYSDEDLHDFIIRNEERKGV